MGRQPGGVGLDGDVGIEGSRGLLGAFGLGFTQTIEGVGDLALQVGSADEVVVDDADAADAGRRQIHQERRAQAAGTDQQHAGTQQLGLADATHLAQHDVAGVALDLFLGEIHGGSELVE